MKSCSSADIFQKISKVIIIRNVSNTALLYRVYTLRNKAAVFIQKHVRGYFVRKDLFFITHPRISLLVKWPFPAISVYMAGNFSNPPWKVLIPLSFSKHCRIFFSSYFLENPLTPGKYNIKFIVDGEWMCNSLILISEDGLGNFNNVIAIPNPSKKIVSNGNLPNHLSLKNPVGPNFIFGTYMAGHPKTRFAPLSVKNTADSLFIDENLQIFGIADGVGEWANYGIDPGLYSKELLKSFQSEFSHSCENLQNLNKNQVPDMMKNSLKSAFNNTKCYGSSTILIGFLYNCTLYILNLGDSGLVILRKNTKTGILTQVFRSSEQQHYFNCPFQLGHFPDSSKYQELISQGFEDFVDVVEKSYQNIDNRLYDWPEDAKVEIFDIENEDVVVVGSDGLFDNVYCEDIIKIGSMLKKFSLPPKDYCLRMAKELVMMAIQKGWDSEYWSPFARNAEKAGMNHRGGKLDDTSVVVAFAFE